MVHIGINSNNGPILLGYNHECNVKGVWKVKLCLDSDYELILDNVRFISELRRDLVSLGTLDDVGLNGRMLL